MIRGSADWAVNVGFLGKGNSALPGPAFAFSGVVAGAAGVSARTYFLYTFLGRIVIMLPLALAGKFAAETVQSLGWVTI